MLNDAFSDSAMDWPVLTVFLIYELISKVFLWKREGTHLSAVHVSLTQLVEVSVRERSHLL